MKPLTIVDAAEMGKLTVGGHSLRNRIGYSRNCIVAHMVEQGLPAGRTIFFAALPRRRAASITDAKNHLSQVIDGIKGGSPVLIVDRDRPVARLEPVTASSETDSDGRHARLVREGIARPGRAHCWRSLGKADEVLGRLGARSADCRRAGNETNADSRRQRSGDARVVGTEMESASAT